MIEKILPIIIVGIVTLYAISISTDMMSTTSSLAEICENEYGTTTLTKEQFTIQPNGCLYIDKKGESRKVFFDYIDNKWIKRAEVKE